ncbi:MAG: hypothetical protein HRT58_21895 [Crocinitomicaceae bacterium]|nr:hypothetical protein [Flavobacteriales bacterium]MCJ8288371.1 hypothetical protein [Flavobacteriales bacterium]NQZ38328.1 hypothetical protein [Crocinitomicaceae bacterium]
MNDELLGRSTVKRRKAAIKLRTTYLDDDYCDLLLEALKIEEDKDNWQTKAEIVKTIGIRRCSSSIEYIDSILIERLEDHDLLLRVSATALVRLKRNGLGDGDSVIDLLKTGRYSVIEGGLEALGYDQMIPSLEQQKEILEICKMFGADRQRGYMDPRYGLAAACAKWNVELVEAFLNNCVVSGDVPLKYVAEKSLQRKYVKLR